MAPKYVAPSMHETSFSCPHCGVLCPQLWHEVEEKTGKFAMRKLDIVDSRPMTMAIHPANVNAHIIARYPHNLRISFCNECREPAIWKQGKIIYPSNNTQLPEPSDDMPDNAKAVYEEARTVYEHSPRAAAALLRLSIEMILKHLLETNKNQLNDLIEVIVKTDIPEHIQKSFDVLRFYGNKGIHAGKINLNDDRDTVIFLFDLTNVIVDELITRKKNIKTYYDGLPATFKEAIEKRDNK